ncbi:MAG: twin-arginine translocase subunit TatC [Sandaracinaceae bacterium]|nr:twin-arginine translocase subunit TatC [Sandaracinaceae bacterium]
MAKQGEPASSDHRPEDDIEMTFFEHLGELRARLIRALLGLLPGLVVGWIYRLELFDLMAQPFIRAWHARQMEGDPQLTVTETTEALVNQLLIAGIVGLLIGAPWVFYQLWAFIAPGLYRKEKRLAVPFMLSSTVFFVGGVAFCYLIVLEPAFVTFLEYSADLPNIKIVENIRVSDYFEFASRMMIAFGITFEVPVVVTFLSFAGIVNWRMLVRFARWWLLISGIVAAVLTPPDVWSQLVMLIPLNVLYWLSILLAALFGPKAPKPVKEAPAEAEDE